MFKEQIVSLVLVVFLSNFVEVSNANKRSGCPYGWSYFYYTKLCYKRFSTSSRVSWMNAQNTCRRNGGDLAIIRNSATNNFVYQCSKGARIWIGAIRSGQTPNYSSQFTWVDGSIPLYSLTEMDNYFPGAFFTLVPFNPNPVNHGSSWIRVKTRPQT